MPENTGALAIAESLKGGGSGYHLRMQQESHRVRVAAAGVLFGRAVNGDRYSQLEFQDLMGGRAHEGRPVTESLSTSDFPILFGDFLSRSLAQRYPQAAKVWPKFATRQVVRDFRPTKVVDFMGGGAVLDRVPELDEYEARGFAESEFETVLAKYGNRLQWSWEMGINDDLGAFQRGPDALSRGAAATEDYVATSVLVDAAGPKTALFGTVDTAPLTRGNLEAAIQSISVQEDEDGNPIDIGTPILVVPQSLKLTAMNIVNTTQLRSQVGTGNGSVLEDRTGNGLSDTPEIVANRWLTSIDKSGTKATSWYLLPAPNGARPAVYETFLQGHENPDLRVKADGGMRLGGGAVDPAEGSFERDDVQYRVRHVVGGNQGFTDAVYASKGA